MSSPSSKPPGGKPPAEDPWDGVLGEKEVDSIPPDMARKLLEMNPKLRESGIDTARLVERGQAAAQARNTGHSVIPDVGAATTSSIPVARQVADALAAVCAQLDSDDQRLGTEIKRLDKERADTKRHALEKFCRWLSQHDPDLRAPATQKLLADEKTFLDTLGFSVKVYVSLQRKGSGGA